MDLPAKPKLIVICGPTAVGKTRFSIDLAQRFDGEIVGADSMQIYRDLTIGTAKPTAQERALVPHHLVDCLPPSKDFSAADYGRRARKVVAALLDRGKRPFVVGGTGLYIKALLQGLARAAPSEKGVRKALRREAEVHGLAALHNRLAALDPDAAERIHPHDGFRIVRALEVHTLTGQPMSAVQAAHRFSESPYLSLKFGLRCERKRLYARIDARVEAMLAEGFLDEVRHLRAAGLDPQCKAMQALGYRHLNAFLDGECEWEEAVRTLKRDHRRYAKRQLTWFGADPEIHWTTPASIESAALRVDTFLRG
ncbi:MAG: tRNA (adenosine(37)-N6)-dimethylallyltransferase MiaA [Desulfosarcinaceae bacterium]